MSALLRWSWMNRCGTPLPAEADIGTARVRAAFSARCVRMAASMASESSADAAQLGAPRGPRDLVQQVGRHETGESGHCSSVCDGDTGKEVAARGR